MYGITWLRAVVTNVARFVVCVSVCGFGTPVNSEKNGEPINFENFAIACRSSQRVVLSSTQVDA